MKVFLRDNFAANILSSFTKVWSAILYSGCYFGTGAFLHSVHPASVEGAALFAQCVDSNAVFMTKLALQLFPLVLRFLQCLRQRRDFLILAASQPVTAAAAAVVEVEMSPAVDYSLEPRIEDALVLNFDTESALFGEDAAGQEEVRDRNRDSGVFRTTDETRHWGRNEGFCTCCVSYKCESSGKPVSLNF